MGIALLLAGWWVMPALRVARGTIPTPMQVISTMTSDGWQLYLPNLKVTAISAAQGFAYGNAAAVVLAILVMLVPRIEAVATALAILSYCTPLLALGPILLVVFGGRAPSIFLAALYCFFPTMVATVAGLRSAETASLDLISAYGGGAWQQFIRVRLFAAAPNTFAALRIAAPSAVLGAILGEYLGGVDSGIGVVLTAAQTAFNIARTWGIAIAATALAGLGYAVVAVAARLLAPWSAPGGTGSGDATPAQVPHRASRLLGSMTVSMGLLVVLWYLFLATFPQIGPRVGKSPLDVWHFLSDGPAADIARTQLADNMAISLRDAALGYLTGIAAAVVLAVLFTLSDAVEQTVLPVALLLRSVPLVAITPLMVLVLGHGLIAVAGISALVVFFPALVLIVTGLHAAPSQALDVVAACGATRFTTLRLVCLPAAVPALFAAARISVPGALVGALLGEWLGSGKGLGSSLIKAIPRYQYTELWASVAAVTTGSLVLYAAVAISESLVLNKLYPHTPNPHR